MIIFLIGGLLSYRLFNSYTLIVFPYSIGYGVGGNEYFPKYVLWNPLKKKKIDNVVCYFIRKEIARYGEIPYDEKKMEIGKKANDKMTFAEKLEKEDKTHRKDLFMKFFVVNNNVRMPQIRSLKRENGSLILLLEREQEYCMLVCMEDKTSYSFYW